MRPSTEPPGGVREAVESSTLLPATGAAGTSPQTAALKLLPIEGLRTLLTISIIVFHMVVFVDNAGAWQGETWALASDGSHKKDVERTMHQFFADSGDTGVTCFFVISGFVAQLPNRPMPESLRARIDFLTTRFLRLAPAYYACLVLVLISSFFAMLVTPGPYCSHTKTGLWSTLMELVMLQAWFPFRGQTQPSFPPGCGMGRVGFAEYGINAADWFVSALFGCQILQVCLAPVFVPLLSTAPRALLTTLGLATLRTLAWFRMLYVDGSSNYKEYPFDFYWHWPPICMLGYATGVAAGRLVNLCPADGPMRSWTGWKFADTPVMLGWLALFRVQAGVPWPAGTAGKLVAVYFAAFFCVMTSCAHHGLTLRVLSHQALTSLAPLCYAAYLSQWFWLNLLSALQWDTASATAVLFMLLATFVGSAAIHHGVEKPAGGWTKRLLAKMAAPSSAC